ncbi:MAG: putative N-methylproline demethylase [Alphaproteobacteria bacterium MarineAlpha3_Bin4]|nr:MAG: putative N-methylproline demethylase [Alphaproteobacteria bacterium MarineAlpha3_Bin4]
MSKMFPHIAEPLQLRHKTLRNRINFGAHTANMSEGGLPGERHLGYYKERALGGAAMIVVEPVPVHATGVLTRGNFRHGDDAIIPHFRKITEACHELGSVMIHQLYHVGQHGDADNSFAPSWSPSGLPSYHDSDGSHAMTEAEIVELIEGFVQAAHRAHQAGFDGIELFAAYHAVIDAFWTPWSNQRDDKWGGSFDNRMRFSTEITERIRKVCGNDFIIGMAVSMDEDIDVALNMESLQEIVAYHDRDGLIDYVTCGTGSYFDFYKLMPTVFYEDKLGVGYAESLKRVVTHARVQAESQIRTAENANTVIGQGQADMVSIVRGQIADAHLVNKALEDRPEDIRGCISCNQMCWGRRYRDYWISCLINPSAGREFEWGGDRFTLAKKSRRILVVGGGPAGLEAARVSAERGHNVTLAEAGTALGGQFRLAGLQPRRGQITDLIRWYEGQFEKVQVSVRLNTFMEAADVREFGADAVVLATGSLPRETGFQRALPHLDPVPGIDRLNVFSVEDVMSRNARPGKRVIVLDDIGHWHGGGTAWHLAEAGHEVIIVTSWPVVGFELIRTTADWPLRRRLKQLGAIWLTEAAVTEWHGDAATVLDLAVGSETRVEADALVLATTNASTNWLAYELAGDSFEIHTIGDAVAPRHANMAFYEGRKIGQAL